MANSEFPTQIILLRDEDDNSRNLIYMASTGETWVRENDEWVDFIIDETNPDRQFDEMYLIPVDPRFIDLWDAKGKSITKEEMSKYEYTFLPDSGYSSPSN